MRKCCAVWTMRRQRRELDPNSRGKKVSHIGNMTDSFVVANEVDLSPQSSLISRRKWGGVLEAALRLQRNLPRVLSAQSRLMSRRNQPAAASGA